jgi:acyl carrier protein
MGEVEVWAAVVAAIREETGDASAEIDRGTVADDIPGWDSLAHVRIVLGIERRLGLKISVAATYDADNVGELVDMVKMLQG